MPRAPSALRLAAAPAAAMEGRAARMKALGAGGARLPGVVIVLERAPVEIVAAGLPAGRRVVEAVAFHLARAGAAGAHGVVLRLGPRDFVPAAVLAALVDVAVVAGIDVVADARHRAVVAVHAAVARHLAGFAVVDAAVAGGDFVAVVDVAAGDFAAPSGVAALTNSQL